MPIVAPLVALGTLALVLWVIAAALAIALIINYIADILHGLIYPLDQLAGPVHSLAQGITNVCGKLENGVDRLAGAAWHVFARYLDTLWHQFEAHAHLLWLEAETLARLVYDHSGLRSIVHDLVRVWHGIEARVKWIEKEWHGIEARVKQLEHDLTRGIGHDLRIGLRKLEREWHTFDTKELPAIEAKVDAIPRELGDLRKWIANHVPLVGTTALVGAVAWALSQLGLGGLRCPSFLNSLNKRGCGLWNGLEDLLGLFVDAAIFLDLCHVIPTVETLFADFEGPLVSLVSAGANAACAHPPAGWVTLPAPTLSLPTAGEITATL